MQREEVVAAGEARTGSGRELVNRAVLYLLLAAFIGAVYAAVVLGLGAAFNARTPNTALSVLATSVAALTFARVRRRAQRLANRLTFGERATPEEMLARFSDDVATSDSPDEAMPRMARIVAEGTGAARAEVWVAVDDALLLTAEWPATTQRRRARVPIGGSALPGFPGVDRVVGVQHHDELLGAIAIAKRSGDLVTATEEKLLTDLASQAGLVLRNVRLTADLAARLSEIEDGAAELRASRQRIVATQDAERRRIERDIHDGAQQHLVALAVKLRMARVNAERDPAKTGTMLSEVRSVIDQALDNLRDLARGIYPPVLAERGVVPALRAQAKRAGLRATVASDGVGRLDPAIETAIYFCCLEAMQNAAKHGARGVTIRLEKDGEAVAFSVTDDGPGFDPTRVARGSGLQNMEDRIAALGGTLTIRSKPGHGTQILGVLGVPSRERAR